MNQNFVERFESYFRHPDPDHDVLVLGDRAVACKNAKAALIRLGVARVFGNDQVLFDIQLAERSSSSNRVSRTGTSTAALALEHEPGWS
jgi:hypothetical protein